MGKEIERKFLLKNEDWMHDILGAGRSIKQGYIYTEDPAVRIRVSYDDSELTIKGKPESDGLTRTEYNIPLTDIDAQAMLNSFAKSWIIKTRYIVSHKEIFWTVDVFEGANAGLVIAEIELEKADETIDLPDWIGEEISLDFKYLNCNLARKPFKSW